MDNDERNLNQLLQELCHLGEITISPYIYNDSKDVLYSAVIVFHHDKFSERESISSGYCASVDGAVRLLEYWIAEYS